MRVLSKVLSVRSSVIALAAAMAMAGGAARAHAETLADAITIAYESNPNIQAQRAAMRALDENYAQARAAYGLQASASVSENYTWQRFVEAPNGTGRDAAAQTNQLAISQSLYTSGRYAARLGGIEAQIKSSRESLRRLEMDLLVRVTSAYVLVHRDREVLRISQGAEAWLAKQLQDTQDKYSVRQITLTDVQQAKARLAAASTQVVNAQAQLNVSVANYAALIGHLPDQLEPEPDIDGLPTNLDEAFNVAEQNNPSLAAALYTEEASRRGVAEARAQRLFSITARADYSNAPGSPFFTGPSLRTNTLTGGVTLTQPLFSSGQLNSAVRQSIEENNRDKLLIDDARRNMVLSVSQYWDQLVAARRTLVTIEDEMKADTIAFYGVREEERFALRSTIEVLNAQAELQNAQLNFVRGRANEYVGRVQLLAQVGTLEVSNLAPGVQPYDPTRHFKKVRYKGMLPTDLIVQTLDHIALPMEPKKPKAGDTTPIRPPSTDLPAKPISANKVVAPQSINNLSLTLDDAPVATAPKN
jgi:TolC family type I secretion outer membrane protein